MSRAESVDVVVIGAGIAGVSAAFNLARTGASVALCDGRAPLTLTSDKSTECYRNWWPGPGPEMVQFMNRSIDLLERYSVESSDAISLGRRGYLFVTADPARLRAMTSRADEISRLGAGPVRTHPGPVPYTPSREEGWEGSVEGADIFLDGSSLRSHFPYLAETAVGGVHARRAGWFSAQQLGAWMLDDGRQRGLRYLPQPVSEIAVENGAVRGVTLGDGTALATAAVVNCAGPLVNQVAGLVGERLPVRSELHLKVAFRDGAEAVPRQAPMIIWNDPQEIGWDPEERQALLEMGRPELVGQMPPSCHGRPEGRGDSSWVLGLWEYHKTVTEEPTWPLFRDDLYPEAVIRGLTTMVPALDRYRHQLPHSVVDGGYYTKTRENRLLVGPMRTSGMFTVSALSGYGVMAACAAGDLLATHVTGEPLPAYAPAFTLDRYSDPSYLDMIARQEDEGQI
jgi:glycine/D-amino acid oxidase-like deaminating enzyme